MGAPIDNKNAVNNDGGRPKIGLSLLWDKWHDDILLLYSQGASDVEVRALIYNECGFGSYTLWSRWIEEEEEFNQVIKIGRLLSETWWHKNGRTNLSNKDFNYTGWYMNMKNRFGWKDNQSIDHTTGGEKFTPTSIVFTKGANV